MPHPDDFVEFTAKSTGERATVAVLPFLSQRWIVKADDLMALDADQHQGQFKARMAAVVANLTAGFDADAVNLVAAHLMVDEVGVVGPDLPEPGRGLQPPVERVPSYR